MHGWRSVSHGTHMGRTWDTRDMRGTHGTLSHAALGRPLIPSHAGVHPMSDRSGSNAAPLPRPATLSPTPRLPCPFLCFSFLIRLSSSQAMGSLGLGDSMNDALVERFWSIIQHLSGKGGGGTSGGTAGGDLSRPLVRRPPRIGNFQRRAAAAAPCRGSGGAAGRRGEPGGGEGAVQPPGPCGGGSPPQPQQEPG